MKPRAVRKALSAVLLCVLIAAGDARVAARRQAPANQPVLRATTEIVLVNVVARDKRGNLVRDLKREDFTLLEDGQKQLISSFDFEKIDELAQAAAEPTVTGTVSIGSLLSQPKQPTIDARDRRLMLFFFDFSAMEPDEIDRSVDAAKKFVNSKMQPADLVGILSLSTSLKLDLDFTSDKQKILSVVSAYSSAQGQGFENGGNGSSEGAAETGGAYTADDTDYSTFSADRKLLALQAIMQTLGKIPQKKSLVYFSNGVSQQGTDNQSALRAATAAAVKANVSIYPVDIRGLQAFPPGGEAQNASLHGQSAYNGAAVLNDLNTNAASQETLVTLAADTGGKAFFDTNEFSGVFNQIQKDTSAYYVLGYTSSNHLKDGHFRRIRIQINRSDVKLEFRPGYYADRDFEHMNKGDREQQLDDELASDLPSTDLAVYAGVAYFREDESHYYLAVSLVVPGSQIPFVQEKDKDSAAIDVIGEVRESGKFRVGQLRDTVKLAVDAAAQVRRKNVQYNTGFVLAPGSYHLKFVFRENRSGRMGSYETDVQIPDLRKSPLRMSSVVLSSFRAPVAGKKKPTPLTDSGFELVPNVAHVFTQDQHLYLQYEVYDPAKGKVRVAASTATGSAGEKPATRESVRVLTSIELLQGENKIYESKPLVANALNTPERKAIVFQMDLPLQSLKPGFYICQVNVIDDVSGNYAFPRWPILIKPAASAAQQSSGR